MNLAEMLAAADAASQGIEVADNNEFAPLPPGKYNVAVVSAEGPLESKRTNPNNPSEHGQYLKLQLSVTGDKYNNRRIWMNNNILVYPSSMSEDAVHKSQVAMAMGGKERKILLSSIGKNAIESAAELVGATCTVELVVTKDMSGKDRNEVKRVMPLSSTSAQASSSVPSFMSSPSSAQQTQASAPAAPARAKMPWEV